jgi:hypothetical protein
MSTGDTPISSEELRNRILGSMKKQFSGEQTSRWLANLDDLPEKLNPEGSLAPPTQEATLPVYEMADKLFDDFQRYIYEFNKNPVGPDLMVQIERPTMLRHAVNKGFNKVPAVAQGHILTRFFAMVLKMYEHGMKAYVIPAENIVAFYGDDVEFLPFLEIDAAQSGNGTVWKVQNEAITPQSLPLLSKRLFSALIKVATGESVYTDPFNEAAKAKSQQPAAPDIPGYRANEKFELRTGRTLPPGAANLPKAAQPDSLYQGANRVAATGTAGAASAPAPAPTTSGGASGAMEHLIADTNRLNADILTFLNCLDEELNQLTQLGIQLLQAQDLATMQKLMNRTTLLKTARDHIATLAEELNK